MVTDLVLPANLWDVDEVVDILVGTKVWAVNRSLAEGGLWDVPFMANLEPITEVATVTGLSFWDSLLMKDLAEDLGLDMEVPKSTTATDKGKRKLGEVPTDLWEVNENPQVVPSLGNVHNVRGMDKIFNLIICKLEGLHHKLCRDGHYEEDVFLSWPGLRDSPIRSPGVPYLSFL
ncbi:hypothetical protein RHMOL_Rhmol02G0238900 [Rhododendron molle]|uniref:Uncharacterized protein n=1 Tax=Rhododendron molle TaxID=49168 RepID=A0ACC0PWJ8_RHOML|nr:hypothetical protein RHMOL_Rhmol02G0238900 [Rhododendron molle]